MKSKQGRRDYDITVKITPHVEDIMESLNYELKKLMETGKINDARRIFDNLPHSDASMISGYVRASNVSQVLTLFSRMWVDASVLIDSFVLAIVLKACGCNSEMDYRRLLYGYSVKTDFVNSVFVGSALLDMYAKCGCIDSGCRVFEEMSGRNVVSWTAIISALGRAGQNKEALRYFVEIAAKACADSNALNYGREIHTQVIKMVVDSTSFEANTLSAMYNKCGKFEYGLGLYGRMKLNGARSYMPTVCLMGFMDSLSVANATMKMYSECGRLDSSLVVFHEMSRKDVVTWSAIISGKEGTKPNEFTLASLLSVCGSMAIVELGGQVHAHRLSIGIERDVMINSSLVNMYSKCWSISEASQIFNAHGYSKKAIDLFEEKSSAGLKPDDVTFLGILSACSHAGFVDLGFHYFRSMSKEYKISSGKEHYSCMIVWSTMLRACVVHRDAERARRIVRFSFDIDLNCAGIHITFCNILAADGQQTEAASVRKNMKSRGVVKEPAWSMVRVNKDQFSTFVARDRSHSQGEEIYSMYHVRFATSCVKVGRND
ncbi:hypothetical protein MKW94_016428 [Papaver nudicaule]|uniref:Pentatricopeptide repeat-containing protein n=1 Tax=Papaver nudicaule TaxID=74823 RepID=A0AA41RQF2_PAPNU|nr:hypothetical protein [Papaver nudicaule]